MSKERQNEKRMGSRKRERERMCGCVFGEETNPEL